MAISNNLQLISCSEREVRGVAVIFVASLWLLLPSLSFHFCAIVPTNESAPVADDSRFSLLRVLKTDVDVADESVWPWCRGVTKTII